MSKQKKQQDGGDDRFKEVYSDPRFMTVPKKMKKVEIDDRFKQALTSKEFNLIQKVDKYGHRVDKQDTTMQQFYKIKDAADRPDHNKYYDDEGKFKWEANSSSGEDSHPESDDDSDEDAPPVMLAQEDDESNLWSDDNQDGHTPDDATPGLRLALTNMDWDNLNATDILALFSSLCKGDMIVKKVEIYPSLFGLEQMKKDTLYGPPKDLFLEGEAKKPKKKRRAGDDELVDEEAADAFNQNQLRKYEIQKMKYFYAVIHCNSAATSDKIYSEYNGYEFELSNIKVNLSFVADDLVFPQQVKETATQVPPGYQFRSFNKLNRALNHTHVKLTWDETDPKRLRKFQKIMTDAANRDDVDDEVYREFLASHSESEAESDDEMNTDKIEEYRRKLLGGLSSAKVDDKRDLQADSDADELDVKFNVGFGEDIGKKVI